MSHARAATQLYAVYDSRCRADLHVAIGVGGAIGYYAAVSIDAATATMVFLGPLLYLLGLSTGDFKATLTVLLGEGAAACGAVADLVASDGPRPADRAYYPRAGPW